MAKVIKEKIKVKEILAEMEAQENCLIGPIEDHDKSTILLLLKVDGEINILDASQEDEPDQETIDMLAKLGCPSWKDFRKEMLFMTRWSQDIDKHLFPKQSSSTIPPHEASHSPEASGG